MAVLLHVDMDAFFASVETRDNPAWRGKPLVVGADPHGRGVVSTCSYEARGYGIRSAMPSRTAYSLCPHAIFVAPRPERYEEVSRQVFEIFGRYSPFVERVSVDEAFLDVTGTVHLHGSPEALARALRDDIRRTVGVTASVGIAPNRLLAKIGSEENKPDGQTLMPFEPAAIAAFLAPKPVSILYGIGAKTAARLAAFGIATCADVRRAPPGVLARIVGEHAAAALADAALGRASDRVEHGETAEKSVSREHTFPVDCTDRETVRRTLLELVEDVGRRLRTQERWARVARIKLRDGAFRTITRQLALPAPVRDDISLRAAAATLFAREEIRTVRLVGFGVAGFVDSPDGGQPTFFPGEDDLRRRRNERLSFALDRLREKGLI